MSLIHLADADIVPALTSIVFDRVEERFVNNANGDRRFALHVRIPSLYIQETAVVNEDTGIVLAEIPESVAKNLVLADEKLRDIINQTPHEDEAFAFDVLWMSSFHCSLAKGGHAVRLEVDNSSEARSYFFEASQENPEDYEEVAFADLKKGRRLDVVMQMVVSIDETRREANLSAVIEEARVLPVEVPPAPRPTKRKPRILGSNDA